VSTEARTRETGIQLCSPTGYMVDLAATKETTDTHYNFRLNRVR
jgi:hypothetical protein